MTCTIRASRKASVVTICVQARWRIAFNNPKDHFLSPNPVALPTKARLFSKCASRRNDALKDTVKQKQGDIIDKDLFLDVLGSTATRRDAKAYLSRFSPTKPSNLNQGQNLSNSRAGSLHLPLRAVEECPVFTQSSAQDRFVDQTIESLHVALVKIRTPQLLNDTILEGVGHTVSQLTRLGLSCAVVIDCEDGEKRSPLDSCRLAREQGDRVVTAIEIYKGRGARRLDGVVGVATVQEQKTSSAEARGSLKIIHRDSLFAPLKRGVIPVIVPIGFLPDTHALVPVVADDVVLALTEELVGSKQQQVSDEGSHQKAEKIQSSQKQTSLDRIILLDPLGGIPSKDVLRGFHVFINLEQEYKKIRDELGQSPSVEVEAAGILPLEETVSNLISSNASPGLNSCVSTSPNSTHLRNLDLLKHTLAILPPSSSAIIITPQDAANSGQIPRPASQSLGVGTRRQQNPLIYNLLTDKPVISSSLPLNRSQKHTTMITHPVSIPSPATFVKRGMPVSIIPDPLTHPWIPPTPSSPPSIQLSDPRIDLNRLVHLIEDSFNRKLDVPHYLSRVNDRIAGIIIAGEYEGGALLTWENPPPTHRHLTPPTPVPYLDKFAVRKRSQGAGGVADVVFKAMVRDCFPAGVCWRSRKDNPVNKWYFERAAGTWKMPGTGWTMFWTGDGVEREGDGGDRFMAYASVCGSVVPSWAD